MTHVVDSSARGLGKINQQIVTAFNALLIWYSDIGPHGTHTYLQYASHVSWL